MQSYTKQYMERDIEGRQDDFADWLDSDAIDGCCQTVVDMCTSDEAAGTNSVFFVSSLAISAALSRLSVTKSTQRIVRRALGIVAEKQVWLPRDLACFSINSGSHWSLLAYFPGYNKHRIYHYDSGRHFQSRGNANYAIKVVQMLARIRLVPPTIQLVPEIGFPTQEGGVECGYYLVAAMANLMECRRQNMNLGQVVTPMDSYNLDLLHQYDLEKLQKIVYTLLFRRKGKSFDCHPAAAQKKTKRKKTKFNPSQPQQTIFFHTQNNTSSAPFSFDDDISDQEENENRYEPPISSASTPTSKRKRKHRRK